MNLIDLVIIIIGWVIGNIIFRNFGQHVSLVRKLFKLAILLIVIYVIGYFFGRTGLYIALFIMAVGILTLHFWLIPKHGINPWTAKPHDKYLELTKRIKKQWQWR